MDETSRPVTRRGFIKLGGLVLLSSAASGLGASPLWAFAEAGKTEDGRGGPGQRPQEAPVNPVEDLMREHGVLSRLLLIYDRALVSLTGGQGFQPKVLRAAAETVRRFIEDYHERLEEDYLFPRFKKAGKMVELVDTLKTQHERGRRLSAAIQAAATGAAVGKTLQRQQLTQSLLLFIRMYRPHKAREDTILFPAFRNIVSWAEFDRLGEVFEGKERQMFGERGFEGVVAQVADLERELGIYELSQFTPPKEAGQGAAGHP